MEPPGLIGFFSPNALITTSLSLLYMLGLNIFQVSTPTSPYLFSLYFVIRYIPDSLLLSNEFDCFKGVLPIQVPPKTIGNSVSFFPFRFRVISIESILSTS